mmetsp:Transcript_21917/g.51684  ORF Transcript_21917/g.51684 Transcript_21917/m.51684 type:complete len:458 (+) Transcript_21917:201-1574(+)
MTLDKQQALDLARRCFSNVEDDLTSKYGLKDCKNWTTDDILSTRSIARLWSGKGSIYVVTVRCTHSADKNSKNGNGCWKFIVKHITGSSSSSSRGMSFGDQRKADSYIVEANFYSSVAPSLMQQAPSSSSQQQHRSLSSRPVMIPRPYYVEQTNDDIDDISTSDKNQQRIICHRENEIVICMSYLEHGKSYYSFHDEDIAQQLAIDWLARFHASHWDGLPLMTGSINDHTSCSVSSSTLSLEGWVAKVGLQRQGNYWHLATRPDEHESMSSHGWEGRLKRASKAIDQCLRRDKMQALIHGDPKSENIMIMTTTETLDAKKKTAAFYDFQYCGQGSPTQDLAYYFCSTCDIDNDEDRLLSYYHERLVQELQYRIDSMTPSSSSSTTSYEHVIPTLDHLKRSLDVAYADYCRFMSGWGYWGTSSSDVQRRTRSFLNKIDNGKDLKTEGAYDEAIRKVYW